MSSSRTSLTGKSVLITGGAGGVGRAMARAFANAGAHVWIAGRTLESLADVVASQETVSLVQADVCDENSVRAMFATCGICDIVIANAGAAQSAPFLMTDLASWNKMIAVNLTGVFLTLREGLRQMPATGGRLIAVASTAGLKGYPYVAPYTAAKHGVVGLVRAIAQEVARSKVTVNAICPGFLDTEMTDRSVETIVAKTGMTAEQARKRLAAANPQGRLIDPSDVAETALWLCSDASASVNGQAIALSGGET